MGTYSFYDEIFLNNENDATADSYQLLDIKLGIERKLGNSFGVDLYGGINNVLYEEYSSIHDLSSGFRGFFDPAMDHNCYAGIYTKLYFLNE